MIYGSKISQRLAFIELGALFNMHNLKRFSVPIELALCHLMPFHIDELRNSVK